MAAMSLICTVLMFAFTGAAATATIVLTHKRKIK